MASTSSSTTVVKHNMRRTSVLAAGMFRQWPWPTKLPLKDHWFHRLSRTESIASENKQVYFLGDLAVVGVLAFALMRFFEGRKSGKQQTRLCHLTGFPPAIVAHEVNFEDVDKNRKVERKVLDEYRTEFSNARVNRQNPETMIFKY